MEMKMERTCSTPSRDLLYSFDFDTIRKFVRLWANSDSFRFQENSDSFRIQQNSVFLFSRKCRLFESRLSIRIKLFSNAIQLRDIQANQWNHVLCQIVVTSEILRLFMSNRTKFRLELRKVDIFKSKLLNLPPIAESPRTSSTAWLSETLEQ